MLGRTALAIAALCIGWSAHAQAPAALDFQYAPVTPGVWSYRALPSGSEIGFIDSSGAARVALSCVRPTGRVAIAMPYPAGVLHLTVWTSSGTRSLPTRHVPAAQQIVAEVPAYDNVLDATAFSRGRFALMVPGSTALVLPASAEIARVVEDCRA